MTHTIPEGSLKSERAIRFGRALERAMKARGVGTRTVADALACSRTSITNYRIGRALPRVDTARRLAMALDTPALESLAAELRRKACIACGAEFLDDSGSDNRRYCTEGCRDVAAKMVVGIPTEKRAAKAERRLTEHQRAVAAYCTGCEPSGRCVTPDCALRPVSPLPLFASRLDLDVVQAKPRNGYREPGADATRQRAVWARMSPEDRAARIARAAEASKAARGLLPAESAS